MGSTAGCRSGRGLPSKQTRAQQTRTQHQTRTASAAPPRMVKVSPRGQRPHAQHTDTRAAKDKQGKPVKNLKPAVPELRLPPPGLPPTSRGRVSMGMADDPLMDQGLDGVPAPSPMPSLSMLGMPLGLPGTSPGRGRSALDGGRGRSALPSRCWYSWLFFRR